MQLYSNQSNNPKWNAQRNLQGRTHYVDDDALRFHKSRVLSARHIGEGLLFAIVCSDALDYQGTRRGFRYSIFDLFGNVLDRPDLEHAFRTSQQATKAMWAAVNRIDAQAVTLDAITQQRKQQTEELNQLACTVMGLSEKQAA